MQKCVPFFLTLIMKEQLKAVETFHKAFGQDNGTYPRPLDEHGFNLRHSLMQEENDEYLEACFNNSLVEIADALGDQLYILCGTILRHGMQHIIEDVFNEIQASNMSKLGDDGKPVLREDLKILKGPHYFKPNLEPIVFPKEPTS
jgi:predicted HAD superfamily Cof-like phosphohydrolase